MTSPIIDDSSRAEIRLAWSVHPFKQYPSHSVVILSIMAFVSIIAIQLFHALVICIAANFLIFGATSEYWLPTKYWFTDEGAYSHGLASRFELHWKDVKRQLISSNSIRLTPLPVASRLDGYRGIVLRFPLEGDVTKEAVLETIDTLIAKASAEPLSETPS